MHPILENFYEKARSNPRRVVLPESNDLRIVRGASIVAEQGLAQPVLLGLPDAVQKLAKENQVSLKRVDVFDHLTADDYEGYCQEYISRRREKGKQVSDRAAHKMISNPLNYAAVKVLKEKAFAMVAGAHNTTANVVKSALFMIGVRAGHKTVSSAFLMLKEGESIGEKGAFIFADCGVTPRPTQEQIIDITISTIKNARDLLNAEPRVALLSFSTYGSAAHEEVERMASAARYLKEHYPNLVIDGELQIDAAFDPSICKLKAPSSPLEGKANVFIFPDLNSGNISYKVAERIGDCRAVGPFFQSLAKPMADLSRGCSVQDIVDTTVVVSQRTTT